jgi:Jacalin-like lectin domain
MMRRGGGDRVQEKRLKPSVLLFHRLLAVCSFLCLDDSLASAEESISSIGNNSISKNDEVDARLLSSAVTVDFTGIPVATTIQESKDRFQDRQLRVLEWFANSNLPLDKDEDVDPNNNPFLDTRGDMRALTDWATARILLDMNTTLAATIFLDPRTAPLGEVGTSINPSDDTTSCHRRGDYDFALMNLLRLVYVARDYPGRFSNAAVETIIRRMLTVTGNDHSNTYKLSCGRFLNIDLQDTENHVLMIQVAQYLTNQLFAELPEHENNDVYDNEKNGNNVWMLDYLATFMRDLFYEYNSRPYQGYSLLAMQLLHSCAQDSRVSLAAEMILDLVSGWSGLQSNKLRRFQPFRRQPDYIVPPDIGRRKGWFSWSGDAEAERLALLVGNYGHLEQLNYQLPPGDGLRHFILSAATNSYRMHDVLLDLAIRQDATSPRFFMASHDAVEIYASSGSALITAGGIFQEGVPFGLAEQNALVMQLVGKVINGVSDAEAGWAQPTTVIPTNESSANILDMIRFDGHQDLKLRENLCVAPGFACGLSPQLGNVLGPVEANCRDDDEIQYRHWRFFDFTKPECPLPYDFHMALHEHPCDTPSCTEAAATGTFGLLELADTSTMSFDDFKQAVLTNNPQPFSSSQGANTYTTVLGHVVEFEVFPALGQSSLIALNGEVLGRDFRQWPRARGDAIQSTTPGRFTLDSSPTLGKRLILDMSNSQQPQRFSVDFPILKREEAFGRNDGRGQYFDDGGSVIPGQGVAWIALTTSGIAENEKLSGLAMAWTSGLQVSHGQVGDSISLGDNVSVMDLEQGEVITEVAIGAARDSIVGDSTTSAGYLRITTSLGQELVVGNAAEEKSRFVAKGQEQIIAFHGRAGANEVNRIGVIFAPI